MKFTMFEVKSIQLEQKISNENEIKLLFNTESTFPCLFPLLFSLRVIRFQSLSTQYSDLMALKDWYIFWYKKYSISFCEFFYSSNYNFELTYLCTRQISQNSYPIRHLPS